MKSRNILSVLLLVMLFMLSGCSDGVSYTENDDATETVVSEPGGQSEEDFDKEDVGNSDDGAEGEDAGDYENKDSPAEGFLEPVDRSYDIEALHRTCIVSMSTSDKEKQENMWKEILLLPSCERGVELYMNPNVKIDIPLENINPSYLEFLKEISPTAYENMEKKGSYDDYIIMYTYSECNKTALTQSNCSVEMREDKPEDMTDYSGGFITNLKAGDMVDGCIIYPLSGEENRFPEKLQLDDLGMQPEWFFDDASFGVYLSLPYEDYIEINKSSEEEEHPFFVVQAKKGKEQKMRNEIKEILGPSGCVLEGKYYD